MVEEVEVVEEVDVRVAPCDSEAAATDGWLLMVADGGASV